MHLNRPVEEVFAFVADHDNLRRWQSNLIEGKQVTDGPLRVGTRFREVRRLGRRPSTIEAELTVFEPNIRFATKTLTQPLVTVSYDFAAEGDGTRLTYTFVMHTRGMMRLLQPLIARSIKKQTAADLAKLKQVLER